MQRYLPLVLHQARSVPEQKPPGPSDHFNPTLQIWMRGDEPLIEGLVRLKKAQLQSEFGETTITRTSESMDTSEAHAVLTSDFGETLATKTSEGTDQTEVATLVQSQFGETLITDTRENTDQSEVSSLNYCPEY